MGLAEQARKPWKQLVEQTQSERRQLASGYGVNETWQRLCFRTLCFKTLCGALLTPFFSILVWSGSALGQSPIVESNGNAVYDVPYNRSASTGRLVIGHDSGLKGAFFNVQGQIEALGIGSTGSVPRITVARIGGPDGTAAPSFQLSLARGTYDNPVSVVSGDVVGRLVADGYSESANNMKGLAGIYFVCKGDHEFQLPGEISFRTSSSSTAFVEAMRIDENQYVWVTRNPTEGGHVATKAYADSLALALKAYVDSQAPPQEGDVYEVIRDPSPGLDTLAEFAMSDDEDSHLRIFNNTSADSRFDAALLGHGHNAPDGRGMQFIGEIDPGNDLGTTEVLHFQGRLDSKQAVVNRPLVKFANYDRELVRYDADGRVVFENGSSLKDINGDLFVRDALGNETQLSPHDENGEWVFYSKNPHTGKLLKVRMGAMMRKLDKMLGGGFIEETGGVTNQPAEHEQRQILSTSEPKWGSEWKFGDPKSYLFGTFLLASVFVFGLNWNRITRQ